MVAGAAGIIVALVSGIFGVCAHGLAAGSGALAPTAVELYLVAAASAGIGAVTAALARKHPPLLTAAAGLLAGQGVVHLVLATGHAHVAGAGVSAGSAAPNPAIGHHLTDPAALRAAIDGASAGGMSPVADTASLLTPAMLGAHVAAVALTLALVAVLSGTLAWVAARVAPLLAKVRLVVVAPLLAGYDARAPRRRYLLTGGGTRAPPAFV